MFLKKKMNGIDMVSGCMTLLLELVPGGVINMKTIASGCSICRILLLGSSDESSILYMVYDSCCSPQSFAIVSHRHPGRVWDCLVIISQDERLMKDRLTLSFMVGLEHCCLYYVCIVSNMLAIAGTPPGIFEGLLVSYFFLIDTHTPSLEEVDDGMEIPVEAGVRRSEVEASGTL